MSAVHFDQFIINDTVSRGIKSKLLCTLWA